MARPIKSNERVIRTLATNGNNRHTAIKVAAGRGIECPGHDSNVLRQDEGTAKFQPMKESSVTHITGGRRVTELALHRRLESRATIKTKSGGYTQTLLYHRLFGRNFPLQGYLTLRFGRSVGGLFRHWPLSISKVENELLTSYRGMGISFVVDSVKFACELTGTLSACRLFSYHN